MKVLDNWGQLYISGFVRIIDKGMLNFGLNDKLEKFQYHIEQTYLNEIFNDYKLVRSGTWQGVDADSQNWHNDSKEGHNLSFLLYLDQCSPKLGGQLEVKTDDSHFTIYPEPGLLVCLNQKNQFQHRAYPSKEIRRVIAFDYHIAELDSL